jgi:hypothetical protein
MQQHGLTCHEQALWTHYIEIGPEAITDALAMTYRAVRQSEKRRLEGIQTTRVTLAAELMRFTKA